VFERAVSLHRGAGALHDEIIALNGLAEVAWAMGDLESAMSAFADLTALSVQSATGRVQLLGIAYCNLAGVLAERGEVKRALAAGREGLPLLQEAGSAWITFDHFALLQALAGHEIDAALLAGFADAAFANRGAERQPNEARARSRLQALLDARFDVQELERLAHDGAKLGEGEACRLALQC
jgi:hypothetical protein